MSLVEQALAQVLANPADSDALGLLGALVSRGFFINSALRLFDHARHAAPQDPRGHFAYGGALQALGSTDEAEIAFGMAAQRQWRAVGSPPSIHDQRPPIALGWKPGQTSGWEVYARNFCKRLVERGDYLPLTVDPAIAAPLSTDDPNQALFELSLRKSAPYLARGEAYDFPVLVALGNDFGRFPHIGRASREIGIMFIEHTEISVAGRMDAERYELIIAGSSWCADIIRGMGFSNVATVIQGIDPTLFYRGARAQRAGKFRVFSGGKIEFRKGQDIVVEAFRRFHARRPDSELVICWHSAVPQAAASVTWGGLFDRAPDFDANGRLDLTRWLVELGIPGGAIVDLGMVPNAQLPGILATTHAAIFPNRCEGGTNLPAMEAMAAGVPTILSANTGHLDLIEAENCIPLQRQRPIFLDQIPGSEGWGSSDIDEAVEALDRLYLDAKAAEEMGALGATTLSRLTWPGQIDKLISAINP
jgi:glycosyltransferase involved in cell wall biosynthesis